MRSHASLAIFAIDKSHRARPHCAIDLATASASRSAKCHDEPMDVDVVVDTPAAVVISPEELLPTWKVVAGVPFPSADSPKSPRKHALLRSSPPLVTSTLSHRKGRDSSDSASPTAENQPPRKRTRTSALLQPPIKSQRSPMRSSPSRLPRSTSSLLYPTRTKEPVPPKPAEDPFTYAFPTSSMPSVTVMPHSRLFDLVASLITPSALDHPSANSSAPLARRRHPFSGGTVLLRNLYKSVVYGLALKYSVKESAQVYRLSSGNTASSPFDIQDALLADRLSCHLTSQGEDINLIASEIEKMDGYPMGSPASAQGVSNPIMSYDRLVSFILLQRNLEGKSKTSRKGLACGKPSRLAESCSIIDID